ncbi:putative Tetratricopeptide TPR_2 repeat protein [Verrucomicrobia bacterium]|nr:putative Tetratricopeptide TPR_2 repeat protein [Verrucomicrobiota bacterium]
MHWTTPSRRALLIGALLGAATVAAFWPLTRYGFIMFDDWDYLVQNTMVQRGLKWDAIRWAFTTFRSGNWHPLTWISYMVDTQIFGARVEPSHVVNLLLHAANAVLLFFLLNRLTGALWLSAFVAALFALHPMHVESVAWLAERKDVLSALFFILTLWAYARYVPSVAGWRRSTWYALALLVFASGLMSKPMLVTLPFVLLLLDYWPLQRLRLNHAEAKQNLGARPEAVSTLLKEKLPFLALSIASSVVTFLAQKGGGAVATLQYMSLSSRLTTALVAYLGYLQKMVWPSGLAILYLRPGHWPAQRVALAVFVLAALTILAVRWGRQRGWVLVGWLWFLGMLVPVIGLVQVGNQYMADRYSYLPLIGLFIIVAWGGWDIACRCKINQRIVSAAALAVIAGAAAATQSQVRLWKNSETLFKHCLDVTSDNWFTHNLQGVALGQGRFEEAREQFLAALRLQPHYADALANLGVLLTYHGDYAEATRYLEEAVSVNPEKASLYAQLGSVLDGKGKTEPAIAYYRQSLRLNPDQEKICNDLAWLLATCPDAKLRDGNEAVRLAEHACSLSGYQKTILVGTLAAAYAEAGRFPDAVATAQRAVDLASASGQTELAKRNRELLERYKTGQPYHEPH